MTARKSLSVENEELKARLAEAEELLAAIKNGEVDAFVTDDQQVFTLKSADHAYRVLVETINEGALTLALDGTVTYCNNCLAAMTGLPVGKIIGSSVYGLIVPEEVHRLKSILLRSENVTARAEFRLKKNDGTAFPALVSCNSLRLPDISLCMVITDLTEQKKAAIGLVVAQTELERAKRLSDIGMLAATVAHELRNPLAAISLAAHNIKRRTKDAGCDKHLASIEKKVGESDQIINNLLFYSRLRPPHRESIKIFDVICECAGSLGMPGKNITAVIMEMDGIKNIKIEADPLQMQEIFHNILNNARDAVSSENGEIRIMAEDEGEFIKVAVEDNGSGMNKDILEKIFDPFFTTKAKGTGLGLPVCRQIINMHGGEIAVKSVPGQGTSVTVRLPKKERIRGS